jgi:hypothetical protein
MEMNYFSTYYPFQQLYPAPFAYCLPSFPFEPFLAETDPVVPQTEVPIKMEESAPKK